MPGYVGRKFALQGDLDPSFTGEAILEMIATHLRKAFEKVPLIDHLREVAQRYEHFVLEGTNLNLEGENHNNNSDSSTTTAPRTEAPSNVEFEEPTAELTDD